MIVLRMWTRAVTLSMKKNDGSDDGKWIASSQEVNAGKEEEVEWGLTFRSNSFDCSI